MGPDLWVKSVERVVLRGRSVNVRKRERTQQGLTNVRGGEEVEVGEIPPVVRQLLKETDEVTIWEKGDTSDTSERNGLVDRRT